MDKTSSEDENQILSHAAGAFACTTMSTLYSTTAHQQNQRLYHHHPPNSYTGTKRVRACAHAWVCVYFLGPLGNRSSLGIRGTRKRISFLFSVHPLYFVAVRGQNVPTARSHGVVSQNNGQACCKH
eukprot:6302172-Amphidinium_carterae.1